MRVVLMALMCLALITPAQAKDKNRCKYGFDHVIMDDELAARGLTEKVEVMRQVITKMYSEDLARRNITVLVLDCPKTDFIPRPSMMFGMTVYTDGKGVSKYAKDYGIYMSTGYLRFTDPDDLADQTRELVCRIYTGAEDVRWRTIANEVRDMHFCRYLAAKSAESTEEARWFNRLLEAKTTPDWTQAHTLDLPPVPPDAPKGRMRGDEFR